jgi:uncharacterized protein YkwD
VTPAAAFLAVLMVAAGGWWLLRDVGTTPAREAGLLAEAAPSTTAAARAADRADRSSRGRRSIPVPALGTVAAAPTTARAMPRSTTAPPAPPVATRTTTRRTSPPPVRTRPPAPPTTTAPAPSSTGGASATEAEVTRLTNVERAKAGCGALRIDARLTTAARAHSADMVDRDYFSHTSPDGKGPGDRAAAAGYLRWSGENIAAGYPTAAAVVQGWMNSEGHRANILNCQSKATGVGYDARRTMWTQMFGFE